ncbi:MULTISPECIES: SCO family protein [unclassified Mucilaginibacter]|uniref:SCO family protein n=1 Tax=unclassified Mucilaginibacter TaxID=2617802 RepID=UPI0008D1BC76|nr:MULTISPECIES: SCO family protein [unclassified Mucilaginibacter]WDF80896.1 SCO family protein [Mucilaginibacter sp. KACC 22773]SEP07327.1 protein SCO1/2 [Mucilaginibacter sp. OK283]
MRKLILGVIVLSVLNACNNKQSKLPILGNREPVTKTVDGKSVVDTAYATIPDFKFVNQYGDTITQKSLDGKIYVADFFFTTCPSICPVMHRNMLNVYKEFKADDNFRIISHTIDPKYDTVQVLKRYADKMGLSGNNWWLLHGDKGSTYTIAKSYLQTVQEKNPAGQYIHDGFFILIDKQKRIRGTYEGTDPKEVDKMIADIKILKAEPDQAAAK